MPTQIAAHRGGAHLWPENSLLAFRKTIEMGVDLVEFDVHRTRDGVLVVHHDAMIDRVTDGSGAVAAMTFTELSRFVIKGTGGERIPTLDEVIAVFEPSAVDLRLEIKSGPDMVPYPGIEAEVASALDGAGMVGRSMVTSFQLPILARCREVPAFRSLTGLVWLVSPLVLACSGLPGMIASAAAHGVVEVGLRAADLDDRAVAQIRAVGLIPHAWAAHTAADAERMFALGVASFTTDRPDLAIAARGA